MNIRIISTGAATLALALLAWTNASAQVAVGGGVTTQSGNGSSSTGAGIIVSTGQAVPILPVSIGVTGFVPLVTGGGYALTLDGRFSAGGNAFGVGYGVGQFGAGHSGGTGTIFLDHKIAPLTSIELRGYKTMGSQGSTAALLAIKFSL